MNLRLLAPPGGGSDHQTLPAPCNSAARDRHPAPLRTLAVVLLGLCCTVLPVAAGLCPDCHAKSHTKDIGSCKECDGTTTSGEFRLCLVCSDRLQQCQQCRKELATAEPGIDERSDATHKSGQWIYQYSVSNPGTKSEGYHGKLSFAGEPVPPPAAVNDHVRTPWGPMYWVGEPATLFGGHGWMPRPLPSKPVGKLVQPPVKRSK